MISEGNDSKDFKFNVPALLSKDGRCRGLQKPDLYPSKHKREKSSHPCLVGIIKKLHHLLEKNSNTIRLMLSSRTAEQSD